MTELLSSDSRARESGASAPAIGQAPVSSMPLASSIPEPTRKQSLWSRAKAILIHHVLHLDDTPHRIAWGVFWGFVIGATPTIGIQFVLYLFIATLVGANRVSGIIPIWISNPVTAVPIFYAEWWLGRFILTGNTGLHDRSWAAIAEAIQPRPGRGWWERFFEMDLWMTVFRSFIDMGAELWVGALVTGVLTGSLAYWLTYRAVTKYRAHRAKAS
ncbi:MAG: DUF2062 domain-containing protein [Myxococcales bacterium]|nr:DUF2062 domain-containing protein [Myxococcales bacterium]